MDDGGNHQMKANRGYRIRDLREADLAMLADLYRSSIRHLGGECYSAEQVEAWSSFPDSRHEFEQWVSSATTLVAVDSDDVCIGFGGLEESGRISALFVSPGWQRMGVGYHLTQRLLGLARSRGFNRVTTAASAFSRPLFEKCGFGVIAIEHTEFKGVEFTRYAMQARIQPLRGSI